MTKERRRRIVSLLLIAVALAVGVAITVRLASYDVPFSLLTACVLGTTGSVYSALLHIEEAADGHHAPLHGSGMRLPGADAARGRRREPPLAGHRRSSPPTRRRLNSAFPTQAQDPNASL